MVAIPLAVGYWDQASERTDRVRLHNMVVAENKASPTGTTYRSRPGSEAYRDLGVGPIRKMWRQDGTLDGAILAISGSALYVGTTSLGDVGSTGISFAGSPDRAIVVADGQAWRTDGVTKTLIVMPDDVPGYEGSPAPVSSVRFFSGFFLLSITGTDRFYWIQPEQDDPDPLDFATSERIPDAIVSIALSGDEIWMLGGEGEEVFSITGDNDAPFQSITGRVYESGCASADSVVEVGTVLAWVTKERTVAFAQGSPVPASDDAIAELLSNATTFKAWAFRMSGHAYYVLTIDDLTLAFDFQSQRWSRFSSFGFDTWRAVAGCQDGAAVYAGDSQSGAIWRLGFDLTSDAGNPLVREVSGTFDNTGPPVGCASVTLRTTIGQGDGTALELKWSDNQGRTFSNWRQIPLGTAGQYDKDAIARSLGVINRPGRTFVWRFAGDSPWRVDYARMNEA